MSDTHAQTVSYVRDTMLPESDPPLREKGVVKWLRENLFSGWVNTVLTLLSLYVIYVVAMFIFPWLSNSVWNAGSLAECRQILALDGLGGHDGACTGVIRDRWLQFLVGFYPRDALWRPILAFVLMFVALAPILFSERSPKGLIWFSAIYPFLATWLLWGGAVWSPILVIMGFVAGFVGYVIGDRLNGQLLGSIFAILAALIWWFFIGPAISDGLNRAVTASRGDTLIADQNAIIDAANADIANIETQQEALQADIAAAVEARAALLPDLGDHEMAEPSVREAVLADSKALTDLREQANVLAVEVFLNNEKIKAARTLRDNYAQLDQRIADLPGARERLETATANVPDAYANFSVVQVNDSSEISDDEKAAMIAFFDAESQVSSLERNIDNTYANAGRIGLDPVNSRSFGGFLLAIIIGVAGIVLSMPLGILLALGRQSDLFIINKVSVVFIETIRGVPLIVWLFTAQLLLNYFLPPGTNFDLLLRVIIMVTLFSAAYIAEVVRGGLAALPKGQYEGADSLGLDYWQSMRLIILPQALKISIPGIVNTFIGLFKDTTLVLFIGLSDPVGLSNIVRASTDWNGVYWELFLFIGVLFFIFCYSMGRYSLYLERKLQREHR